MAGDWEAFKFLLGKWEGSNTGDPGEGQGSITFNFDLDQNILVRQSSTEFPLTPERAGIIHQDLMILYHEITGSKRAIYFDNEGHVIHYEVSMTPDGKTVTLVSDAAPSSPQFRFTYIKVSESVMNARFEIAPPGQPGAFMVYIEGKVRRVK